MKGNFNYKNISLLTLLCVGSASYAADLTNNITGVGSANTRVDPYYCIQETRDDDVANVTYQLDPGATVSNPGQYTGHPDYNYVGGALRFNATADPSDPDFDAQFKACDPANTYLGYLGLNFNDTNSSNNSIKSYTPPDGVHIALINPSLNSSGSLTGEIAYTLIPYNASLASPSNNNSAWPFVGINLSGFEFGKVIDPTTAPNLSEEDKSTSSSDLDATQTFINEGANTIRFPLDWGYLQPDGAGKGDLYTNYVDNYIKPALETTTHAGVHTIVDLHAYMHYNVFGKQYAGCQDDSPCPDGTMETNSDVYVDIWTKLYEALASDSKINMDYIIFDLINEPVLDDAASQDAPESPFDVQVAVIKALREDGFKGYILVEGNEWSGLHSWTTATWGGGYTNATLFTRERFEKENIDLDKIVINVHQYFDADYSGTTNTCQRDLQTTGPNGFNLQEFADYLKLNRMKGIVTEFGSGTDEDACTDALQQFLDYLQTNAAGSNDYGFIGWTIWSTGHGWGEPKNGEAYLRVKPTSYQWQTLLPYLTETSALSAKQKSAVSKKTLAEVHQVKSKNHFNGAAG